MLLRRLALFALACSSNHPRLRRPACPPSTPTVTFADLWQGYVTGNPYRDPASGGVPPASAISARSA